MMIAPGHRMGYIKRMMARVEGVMGEFWMPKCRVYRMKWVGILRFDRVTKRLVNMCKMYKVKRVEMARVVQG